MPMSHAQLEAHRSLFDALDGLHAHALLSDLVRSGRISTAFAAIDDQPNRRLGTWLDEQRIRLEPAEWWSGPAVRVYVMWTASIVAAGHVDDAQDRKRFERMLQRLPLPHDAPLELAVQGWRSCSCFPRDYDSSFEQQLLYPRPLLDWLRNP